MLLYFVSFAVVVAFVPESITKNRINCKQTQTREHVNMCVRTSGPGAPPDGWERTVNKKPAKHYIAPGYIFGCCKQGQAGIVPDHNKRAAGSLTAVESRQWSFLRKFRCLQYESYLKVQHSVNFRYSSTKSFARGTARPQSKALCSEALSDRTHKKPT